VKKLIKIKYNKTSKGRGILKIQYTKIMLKGEHVTAGTVQSSVINHCSAGQSYINIFMP